MRDETLSEIITLRDQIETGWSRSVDAITSLEAPDGARVDWTASVPGISKSLAGIQKQFSTLLSLSNGLAEVEDVTPIPDSNLTGLRSSFQALKVAVESAQAQLGNIDATGGASGINVQAMQVTSKGGTTVDLAALLREVHAQVQVTLTNLHYVLAIVTTRGYDAFANGVSRLAEAESRSRSVLSQLSQALTEGQSHAAALAALRNQGKEVQEKLGVLFVEAEKLQQALSKYKETGDISLSAISAVRDQADTLKASVTAYQAEFERFRADLDTRNNQYAGQLQATEALISRLNEQQKTTDTLIQKSDDLLKGATNAALGGTFKDLMDDLGPKVDSARNIFYMSIGALFVCSLPLAIYLFGSAWHVFQVIWGGETDIRLAASADIGKVLSFLVLVLPPAWAAKFSANRHQALFRLKEHYAYKYSLAMSVEGFRKQAPAFEDEVAFNTFKELAFNPADKMEVPSDAADHPNPLVDLAVTTIEGLKRKRPAAKSAE